MLKFIRKTALWVLLTPLAFTFVGAASNQLVLIANGDTFPVLVNEKKVAEMTPQDAPKDGGQSFAPSPAYEDDSTVYLDDVHAVMNKDSHLKALADIFDLKEAIYSVGDFLLMLGEWLMSFAPAVWFVLAIKKLAEAKEA